MKVTPPPNIAAPRAPLPVAPPSGQDPAPPVARAAGLSLSDAARAPGALPQSPLQQASRLSELRTAITEGHYQVDPALIAERLLQWQL